ncbi:hypothetical protein BDF21DRAFT_498314 [Thamnidium elegans]|uniref:NAD(P)-binding protein n=1 Tax=Thamnidium elegans TaxID=101142 RepID=A0A8H7VTI5_9FUNG|nr:hypothetical protein INT48_003980 [Thamnidium elegans]KAI8051794.1 hypothetical protein BDF21DRAFT_498314 [Thamnidium elegans]
MSIILITGASNGLGRLTAKKCIDLGHTVIITGRSQTSLDDAKKIILKDSPQSNSNLYDLVMDLLDLASVKKAVETLETFNLPCIDVILHNAGGNQASYGKVNDSVEQVVFMNAVAPLYLNQLLLPFIEKSQSPKKRIIFVGSSLHDRKNKGGDTSEEARIPDNIEIKDLVGDETEWNMMKYYKISKLAVVWDTYCLSNKLPSDIPVITFCPGFVPTTELARKSSFMIKFMMKYILSRFSFATTEEESTDDYIYYITSDEIKNGEHYQKRVATESSKDSLDQAKQDAYWEFANTNINKIISKE